MSLTRLKNTSRCFGCGADNPLGLRVPFTRMGENGSQASYTAREEHAGWEGILHGGVTFSLMDEGLGWCLYFQEISAVTAKVETRFVKPIAVGTAVRIKAWTVKQNRRLVEARAEIRVDDEQAELLAEADATMFLIK